jgi:predicted dehydrogenase
MTRDEGSEIGVAMLGYGFMGKAHAQAFRAAGYVTHPAPLRARLVSISGRTPARLRNAQEAFGFAEATPDWREQVADPRVGLFDNVGPNLLHVEPTLAAVRAGKHVICEKPLAPTADEAFELWSVARKSRVVHLCAFNYRFFPAIELARQMIARGDIGRPLHFRSQFIVPSADRTAWRFDKAMAGSGALGDMASHHIDAARHLVGEIAAVSGRIPHFGDEPEGVDDAAHALLELDSGATGTIEVSRVAPGHAVRSVIEIDGSDGSLRFAVERLNELEHSRGDGFQRIFVTKPEHPFMNFWFPHGHGVGWGDSFVHEIDHALRAIAGETPVAPIGATFEDGYRCAAVCEAILRSNDSGKREPVVYRTPE